MSQFVGRHNDQITMLGFGHTQDLFGCVARGQNFGSSVNSILFERGLSRCRIVALFLPFAGIRQKARVGQAKACSPDPRYGENFYATACGISQIGGRRNRSG